MNAALTPQNVVYTQALCMSPRSLAEAGGPTPACPSQHPAGGAASLSNNRPSSFLRIIKQEKCQQMRCYSQTWNSALQTIQNSLTVQPVTILESHGFADFQMGLALHLWLWVTRIVPQFGRQILKHQNSQRILAKELKSPSLIQLPLNKTEVLILSLTSVVNRQETRFNKGRYPRESRER